MINLERFFQAVNMAAVKQINVFDLKTFDDVIAFWNAMSLLEAWMHNNP